MLEKGKIGEKIFADVNNRLDEAGLVMHGGTVVDASLIAAPKSTKTKPVDVIRKCTRQERK